MLLLVILYHYIVCILEISETKRTLSNKINAVSFIENVHDVFQILYQPVVSFCRTNLQTTTPF